MCERYGAMNFAHLVEIYLNDQEIVKSVTVDHGNQTLRVELTGCYYKVKGAAKMINHVCAFGWDMAWAEPSKVANNGIADKIIIRKDNGKRR